MTWIQNWTAKVREEVGSATAMTYTSNKAGRSRRES